MAAATDMTIDHFLERFVEGYLFGDLRSMADIKLRDGEEYGAVGYPMVMTALAGVELFGALTSAEPYTRWKGHDRRFRAFWRDYLYPNLPPKTADVVYALVRNGLAHIHLAKPLVMVTKHRDPRHLIGRVAEDQKLTIDALTLADDLHRAYQRRVKPECVGAVRERMQQRLNEIRDDGADELMTFAEVLDNVPVMSWAEADRVVSRIDSPTVSPTYSTFVRINQSTKS
jgi:hypothetical protein